MFGHGQMKDRGDCLVDDALHNSNLGPGGPSPAARSVASPICMQLASLLGEGGLQSLGTPKASCLPTPTLGGFPAGLQDTARRVP